MKVCVISGSSFEKNYASYHLMRDLICGLLDHGDKVRLIQKCYKIPNQVPLELIDKKDLLVSSVSVKEADKKIFLKRMIYDILYYIKVGKYIYRYKDSDVFFLQSNNVPWISIVLVKILTKKTVVYNVQDIFPQNAIFSGMIKNESIIAKILLWLQKWALKSSDFIITISQDMKKTLVDRGVQPDKISVIYNWENSVKNESSIPKIEDGKYHVVYAGNIGVMQNVEIIVQAASMIANNPEIQFDIYGNGVLRQKCVELAKKLNATNISFYDAVPADQAYALYQNADLNIIPLAKNIIKTALPSKTAVCVKSGKPVIFCIDCDSHFASLVGKHNVVNPDDAKQLSELISRIKQSDKENENQWNNILMLFNKDSAIKEYRTIFLKACRKQV